MDIENELNRAPQIEPEKAFRDAVDRCIRASRKMRDKIIATKDTPKPKSKKCAGKGPQTAFKQKQRQTFKKFLERRPITPSQSVITRAHQCWLENKKEWDEAAKRGEGYFDYKNLARAN